MTDLRVVESGSARAVVDLDDGARMTELALGGVPLLVPHRGQEPMWWGAFVMAPWTSLLRAEAALVDGVRIPVPVSGDEAWHGVARAQRWREAAPRSFETALDTPWPLGGTAGMTFEVSDAALKVDFSLTAGEAPLVGELGWHPWFPRRIDGGDEVRVRIAPDAQIQERDAAGVPTGGWVPSIAPSNDCVRTGEPVELRYPGVGTLRIASSGGYLIVFTEHEQGVCIEPCTGPAELMEHRLAPGETLSLCVELTWTPE